MKAIIINKGNDPIQKMVMFPEDAAGDPGRRCAVGFRFIPRRSIAQAPDGKCLTDENGHDIWELDPSLCKLEIHPRLFGRCATWEEIIIALYWGEGDTFGEQLERFGGEAHRAREYPWRVQKERFSGYTEYRIRESEDETGREFGLAGRIAACLRITPNDKVNEGMPLELSLADWYVFLNTIPSRPWAELEEAYRGTPPKEMFPIKAEWNAPGAEPWEVNKPAPGEEGAQPHTDNDGQEEAVEVEEAASMEEDGAEDPHPKKYEILWGEEYAHPDTKNFPGVHRIRALRDIPRWRVKAGDLGGYVWGEHNLSHDGSAWIGGNAVPTKDSFLSGEVLDYF